MNVVVLRGRLAAEPAWFETVAGVRIAAFDLVVMTDAGRELVPVSWADPPAWAGELVADDELVVRGRVRKRFARSGGASRPFTDVVAGHVVRGGRRVAVRKLVREAAEQLEAA